MENRTLFVQWLGNPNHTTLNEISPGAEKKSPPSSGLPGRWMKVSRVKNGSSSSSEHVCCFPVLKIRYYKNRFALWSQMACNTSQVKFSLMTMAIATKEPLGRTMRPNYAVPCEPFSWRKYFWTFLSAKIHTYPLKTVGILFRWNIFFVHFVFAFCLTYSCLKKK